MPALNLHRFCRAAPKTLERIYEPRDGRKLRREALSIGSWSLEEPSIAAVPWPDTTERATVLHL